MKPAVTLFFGIFASGLALGSFVKPALHKVSCKSFYTLSLNNGSALTQYEVAGPELADKSFNGVHQQSFYDENFGVSFDFSWDEGSDFRDLHSEVKAVGDNGNLLTAVSDGKPVTAVHLRELHIKPRKRNKALVEELNSVSLFCGISDRI